MLTQQQYPTRERCAFCKNINYVGFAVPNEIWDLVVKKNNRDKVHCLDCFIKLADEQLIEWDKDIKFYPVSLRTHIEGILSINGKRL